MVRDSHSSLSLEVVEFPDGSGDAFDFVVFHELEHRSAPPPPDQVRNAPAQALAFDYFTGLGCKPRRPRLFRRSHNLPRLRACTSSTTLRTRSWSSGLLA